MKSEVRGSIRISQGLADAIKDAQTTAWIQHRVKVSQSELLEQAWSAFANQYASDSAPLTPSNKNETLLTSGSLSKLLELRSLLVRAIATLDGLSDGQISGDDLAQAAREVDEIVNDSGDARKIGRSSAPHGVKLKQGRRAQ